MTKKILILAILAAIGATGCTRGNADYVNVIIDSSGNVSPSEDTSWSLRQITAEKVLHTRVNTITTMQMDMQPMTKDGYTLEGFDLYIVYNIAPDLAADLYAKTAEDPKTYHSIAKNGDVQLMYEYIRNRGDIIAHSELSGWKATDVERNISVIKSNILFGLNKSLDVDGFTPNSVEVEYVIIKNLTVPAKAWVDEQNAAREAAQQNNVFEPEIVFRPPSRMESELMQMDNSLRDGAVLMEFMKSLADSMRESKSK